MVKKSLLYCISLIAAAGLGYASANSKSGVMISANELDWQDFAPGSPLKAVTLWGDRTMARGNTATAAAMDPRGGSTACPSAPPGPASSSMPTAPS